MPTTSIIYQDQRLSTKNRRSEDDHRCIGYGATAILIRSSISEAYVPKISQLKREVNLSCVATTLAEMLANNVEKAKIMVYWGAV